MSVRVRGKTYEPKNTEKGPTLELPWLGIKSLKDIEGLENLTDLQGLILNSNEVSRIEGLDALPNLAFLSLANNKVARIEGLGKLPFLKSLNLANNLVPRIEGLDHLTRLERLYLDRNQISRIEGFDTLVNLKEIFLGYNRITRLEGFDSLVNLEFFSLVNNRITTIEGLGTLAKLKRCNLDGNPVAPRATGRSAQELVNWCRTGRDERAELEARSKDALAQKVILEKQRRETGNRQLLEIEERGRVEKLKKHVRVSETLEISQIASYLGLAGDEVFRRLVDWAAEFGFTIDRQVVRFGEGKREAFITDLEKAFASWGCKDIKT